ncbi:hypothetical protein AKJ63_00790 [candidate division MSBL1 archaeon SCGC-AAA259D18]|uniref:Transcription regulator AsnC/Lrp ligand binding domain-containing protein n=2 Tax=candidate division MSBL1 TaxID=215777 RepID=A0A133U9U4_9EURY|nr:hypothetical protein AKJ57_02965 [candidate division MSBL1 archaeon SCGC-AAA259A05]KXA91818.1 hypothetical protein AKJ63_00790 [candidate division MSBL1 archaeon SCGC-AAA259D18]
MPESLILITTEVGAGEKVYKEVREKPEIQKAALITGQYDVMAIARAEDMEEIRKILMTEIRNIDGVRKTITNVVIE